MKLTIQNLQNILVFKKILRNFIKKRDCVILPSYREGMPKITFRGIIEWSSYVGL